MADKLSILTRSAKTKIYIRSFTKLDGPNKGVDRMNYTVLGGKKISKVGIGGHYSKMEEGRFETSYAEVGRDEIKKRTKLMEQAFNAGINYFDTTWRNEVDMFSESIRPLGIRDQIHVNGMVLGSFTGSKAAGLSPEAYLDQWLDDRLSVIPGNHFDSFMINAIEEGYDKNLCGELLEHLKKRKQNGDFSMIGFSCHNHLLARQIADTFPEFELIMLAYNYKNRSFEDAFDGYKGNAFFVAMKPLIWYEYGIPFSKINQLPKAERLLNQEKDPHIASKAVAWNLKNSMISTCVCGINSQEELDDLITAGSTEWKEEYELSLKNYRTAIEAKNHLPFLLSACLNGEENRRSFQFGLLNLAKAFNLPIEAIPLNKSDSDERLKKLQIFLLKEAENRGLLNR